VAEVAVTFEQLQETARAILGGAASLSKEDFARKVEEWVSSQPEWLRDTFFGMKVKEGEGEGARVRVVVVRRSEIPRRLVEDDWFYQAFLRFLAGWL
jgi:hypothetical protein